MERKIGEIFEYKGEWYQCVRGEICADCAFAKKHCDEKPLFEAIGTCSKLYRKDAASVSFKKLEKVGEPFTSVGKLYQHYKVFDIDNVYGNVFWCVHNYKAKTLTIEIKQTQEDMEEKKQKLDKLVDDYMACRIQYAEFDKEIKALYDKEESEPTLKQFDLEDAKSGKPVCTRDGRKARIICFDRNHQYPVVALIECKDGEEMIAAFTKDGETDYEPKNHGLMMLPEKKEMWINIYRGTTRPAPGGYLYDTEEEAKDEIRNVENYITTVKLCWEE